MKKPLFIILLLLLLSVERCSGFLNTKASRPARRSPLVVVSSSSPYPEGVTPRQLVSKGMDAFRNGDVDGSIKLFDQADAMIPDGSLTPFLWQRGLSYYYADQFEDASKQFRIDVKVNPRDVEEIVWDIASVSRLNPSDIPPKNKMSLPEGMTDRRRIMGTVYSLFRGEATELELAAAGHQGNIADEFYALFYLGLFCESRGETAKAANYMKQAVKTDYATNRGRGDYMTSCARVHCKLRGW
ncbi:Inherit from NOG: expressed protein [Seminavis robusta]|uniref:Inherit from NOG: expressed protein n=1 Tax=Seminavis robusta TaxID=568900 RepID=A0A9N8H9V4_9STRA|nr:Inherit from NOG: expressed protein [Seminavis robusta]|eukprot:Sro219_g090330.1 Inherit from NOG: expressed protein (242) ;mRNA; r:17470-18508